MISMKLQPIVLGAAVGAFSALVLDVALVLSNAVNAKEITYYLMFYGMAMLGVVPAAVAALWVKKAWHFLVAVLSYTLAFAGFFNLGAGLHQNLLLVSGTFYYIIPKSAPFLLGASALGFLLRFIKAKQTGKTD